MTAARRLAIATHGYRGAGGGGPINVTQILLDEIDFELEAEPVAVLENSDVGATIATEITGTVEDGDVSAAVETETTADLEDEFSGEVDC